MQFKSAIIFFRSSISDDLILYAEMQLKPGFDGILVFGVGWELKSGFESAVENISFKDKTFNCTICQIPVNLVLHF